MADRRVPSKPGKDSSPGGKDMRPDKSPHIKGKPKKVGER